ncbi:MAG TPA: CoA transferase [Myxococcales bacterium]|jgi:crotonobetainyl-CoA:carnitine CoA-transferase CaiB-like acyl-CoA transferase|nr:CoA transferase [Myxococcales bacterium]
MTAPGPLQGIRIVDLTTVIMGPYATQILADYGAEVIKVEPPEGDIMRGAAPMNGPAMGHLHLQMNRNKRGIVLDVKKEGGRRALLRLCEKADVFVHNVRSAAMQRLRLSYEDVRAANPRMVYASLLGYGSRGPYAGRPAYDDLIQGGCALPALFAKSTSGRPAYVPANFADRIVGVNAVHVILAALLCRERTGQGQEVELPMFETLAQFVLTDHLGGLSFDPPRGPPGYSRLLHRRPFETKDGYVCALVYNDKQWSAFFKAIGRSELAANARLATYAARARNYDEAYGVLSDIFKTRTTGEWLELLEANDIPCVRLNQLEDLIADPHLGAVGFFHEMDHPTEGHLRLAGIPSRWSRSRPKIERGPPRLGEHSVEVLREAGYSAAEIEQLIAEGATIDGS